MVEVEEVGSYLFFKIFMNFETQRKLAIVAPAIPPTIIAPANGLGRLRHLGPILLTIRNNIYIRKMTLKNQTRIQP